MKPHYITETLFRPLSIINQCIGFPERLDVTRKKDNQFVY
uniref:Uncharacterized protein n=1 Tax=Rhizophora mucronata TaxID=61149 RepID=A0A2P2MZ85_RHIMU